jgi:holo-[acyl-carrier protein] synthase
MSHDAATETGSEHGVVARAAEVVEVDEARRLLAAGAPDVFSPEELAYARARVDPERRLAARLAAKRAACRLLGPGVAEKDVEVRRSEWGPPVLQLSEAAATRLSALGADRILVSLTHERKAAGALVLLLRGRP